MKHTDKRCQIILAAVSPWSTSTRNISAGLSPSSLNQIVYMSLSIKIEQHRSAKGSHKPLDLACYMASNSAMSFSLYQAIASAYVLPSLVAIACIAGLIGAAFGAATFIFHSRFALFS